MLVFGILFFTQSPYISTKVIFQLFLLIKQNVSCPIYDEWMECSKENVHHTLSTPSSIFSAIK